MGKSPPHVCTGDKGFHQCICPTMKEGGEGWKKRKIDISLLNISRSGLCFPVGKTDTTPPERSFLCLSHKYLQQNLPDRDDKGLSLRALRKTGDKTAHANCLYAQVKVVHHFSI